MDFKKNYFGEFVKFPILSDFVEKSLYENLKY